MDFTAIISYLMSASGSPIMNAVLQLIASGGAIKNVLSTGGSIDTVISKLLPEGAQLLQALGEHWFPQTSTQLAKAAAIDKIFDKDGTTWVQTNLNTLGANPKLTVDGDYGQATKAAVTAYQTKNGLKVDGWSGPKTSALIATQIAKLGG